MIRHLFISSVLTLILINLSYAKVEIRGIVTSNDTLKPIDRVLIQIKTEVDNRSLGTTNTISDGSYSLKVNEVDQPVIIYFIPLDPGNAPDTVKLLSGNKPQQINKVLRAGNPVRTRSMAPRSCPQPCCPQPCCPPIESSEEQKIEPIPEGESNIRKMSSNDRLKDALEKLASFENFSYRLIQINNPDNFDLQMKKTIVDYMRNMPPAKELIYGEDQYSQGLYNALTRKREIVFSLYNLENIEQTRVNSPEPCCHVYKCKKRHRKSRKCRVRKKCWRR